MNIFLNTNNDGINSHLNIINVDNLNRYNYNTNSSFNQIYNNLVKGNIKEEGPTVNINNNKIKLKIHQKRMVYEMIQRENIDYRLTSRINGFVLCDKVGSGKSIDVLSLISLKPHINKFIPNNLKYKPFDFTYCDFYGINLVPTVNYKSNLIVIPHGIYNQWIEYLEMFENLTYYGIKKMKDLNNIDLKDVIDGKYNVILLKSTRYNDFCLKFKIEYRVKYESNKNLIDKFQKIKKLKKILDRTAYSFQKYRYVYAFENYFNELKEKINDFSENDLKEIQNYSSLTKSNLKITGPLFERVFFDEASTIKLPRCRRLYGKINWFITSSFNDLMEPHKYIKNTGFIKNMFCYNNSVSHSNFIQEIYLKNNDEFIKKSFELPEPISDYIECYTPYNISILNNIALPEVINALNAGDVNTAINLVGCKTHNESDIKKLILYKLNTKLKNLNKKKNINNYKLNLNSKIINNLKKIKSLTQEELFSQTNNNNNNNNDNNIFNNNDNNNNNNYINLMSIEEIISNNFNTEYNNDIYNKLECNVLNCSNLIINNLIENNETNELEQIIINDNCDEYIENNKLFILFKIFIDNNKDNIFVRYKATILLKKIKQKIYNITTILKSVDVSILNTNTKITSLENRISNINDNDCPICISKVDKPCITNCCKQTFCFKCITMSINIKKKCPICRSEKINLSQLTIYDNSANNIENNNTLLTKNEALLKLLKDKPDGRFLIFSEFNNTFNNIIELLNDNDIQYNRLLGSCGRIRNIINDYKNNKVNILLLNAKHYGSGLNLQMTSDIIIYHRMNKDLEEQLIGRGQRLGRTSQLKIHYLCYNNELQK